MSSDTEIAIQVEGLSKRYMLGEETNVFTLVEFLAGAFQKKVRQPRDSFYALKDISFSVPKGEVLGVIGRNGAGKSTLLKVLSRITPPSEGRMAYNGSLASLLEVGTGFKQELTGRDNIFLNGALLGLSRRQIRSKLDEISAFAEIDDKFLSTPVKRYSSGMYVRLAFAVAAHLEPDILLVDEVLAVGDLRFQRKCLRQMNNISEAGRTVLFVSHNMQAVTQLCSRVLLLDKGEAVAIGSVDEIVGLYQERLRAGSDEKGGCVQFEASRKSETCVLQMSTRNGSGEIQTEFDILEDIHFEMRFQVFQDLDDCLPFVRVHLPDGNMLYSTLILDSHNFKHEDKRRHNPLKAGKYIARGALPAPLLNSGFYELHYGLTATHVKTFDFHRDFFVEVTDHKSSFASCIESNRRNGNLAVVCDWSLENVQDFPDEPTL